MNESIHFFEILLTNTKAWVFTILTFGGFGIITLFQIFPKILNLGLFSQCHYFLEILAILTEISGIPFAIKYTFRGVKKNDLKLFIFVEMTSYTLLVLAAWLETIN